MKMKRSVLATALGCLGTAWMTSSQAFFCFSSGSGARSQPTPAFHYQNPVYYPPPVVYAYPGTDPGTTTGYTYSPAPYSQHLVVPLQHYQQ